MIERFIAATLASLALILVSYLFLPKFIAIGIAVGSIYALVRGALQIRDDDGEEDSNTGEDNNASN